MLYFHHQLVSIFFCLFGAGQILYSVWGFSAQSNYLPENEADENSENELTQ